MQYCYSCKNNQHLYEQGKAAFVYNRSMKSSIAAFKYGARKEYGRYYAVELAKKHESWIKKTGAQALIPVPIHKERHKKRGYNQAEILARELGKRTGIAVCTDRLLRIRNTRPLKLFDRKERMEVLQGAFAVRSSSDFPENILLIDDIYTSGSTMEHAAGILKRAGVQNVYFLTVSIGQER